MLDGILQGLERVVGYQAALIALSADDNPNDQPHFTVNAVRGSGQTSDIIGQQIDGSDPEQAVFDLLHKLEASTMHSDDAHNHLYVPLQVAGDTIGYLAIDRIGLDKFQRRRN